MLIEKTGVAIVGCGTIFPVHSDVITSAEDLELLCVVDDDEKKAIAAGKRYGCRYVTNYEELLDDGTIQVVHLCTPHYLHHPMAVQFMEAGKHVLVEKPMGLNVEQCREMNLVSQKTGCYLGVCFQNRYHDTSRRIKEIIESKSMGRVLGARGFVTWERDETYYSRDPWHGTWEKEGGSLLMNQAIHTLDLLQWFIGEIKDVRGSTSTHFLSGVIETEDTAEAMITFGSGARALFYGSNAYVSNVPVFIEIACEKGTMTLNRKLFIRYNDGRCETVEDMPPKGYKSYWGTGHKKLIRDFYDCIRREKPFSIDGVEGEKAIRIIQKLYTK